MSNSHVAIPTSGSSAYTLVRSVYRAAGVWAIDGQFQIATVDQGFLAPTLTPRSPITGSLEEAWIEAAWLIWSSRLQNILDSLQRAWHHITAPGSCETAEQVRAAADASAIILTAQADLLLDDVKKQKQRANL